MASEVPPHRTQSLTWFALQDRQQHHHIHPVIDNVARFSLRSITFASLLVIPSSPGPAAVVCVTRLASLILLPARLRPVAR